MILLAYGDLGRLNWRTMGRNCSQFLVMWSKPANRRAGPGGGDGCGKQHYYFFFSSKCCGKEGLIWQDSSLLFCLNGGSDLWRRVGVKRKGGKNGESGRSPCAPCGRRVGRIPRPRCGNAQTIEHLSDIFFFFFFGPLLGDVMTANIRWTELASTVYNMAPSHRERKKKKRKRNSLLFTALSSLIL